jgi:hypothetical protein
MMASYFNPNANLGELSKLFGPPAVLRSENRDQYDAIFQHLTGVFMPVDFFELVLLHQLTEAIWLILRYGRHQTVAIERSYDQTTAFQVQRKKVMEIRQKGLAANLAETATQKPNDVAQLARLASEMIEGSVSDIDDLCHRTPAEIDHNRAIENKLAVIGELEKLKVSAEKRFHETVLLFEHYREGLGQRLREAAEKLLNSADQTEVVELEASEAPSLLPLADAGSSGNKAPDGTTKDEEAQ